MIRLKILYDWAEAIGGRKVFILWSSWPNAFRFIEKLAESINAGLRRGRALLFSFSPPLVSRCASPVEVNKLYNGSQYEETFLLSLAKASYSHRNGFGNLCSFFSPLRPPGRRHTRSRASTLKKKNNYNLSFLHKSGQTCDISFTLVCEIYI